MARSQRSTGNNQPPTTNAQPPSQDAGEAGDLTTFPIQKFPVEIQIKIWKYAASDLRPRVVELSYQRRKHNFTSPTLAPPLLHICSASRVAALQRYQPLKFGTYFTGTYMDWENDTIFFNDGFNHPEGEFYGKLETVDASALYFNCKRVAMGSEKLQNVCIL
jgi:hypothetical protein